MDVIFYVILYSSEELVFVSTGADAMVVFIWRWERKTISNDN